MFSEIIPLQISMQMKLVDNRIAFRFGFGQIEISFGFGISAFVSFGIRQKHTFRPKEAVSAKIDLIGPSIFY